MPRTYTENSEPRKVYQADTIRGFTEDEVKTSLQNSASLPSVTVEDAGKALVVDENGNIIAGDVGTIFIWAEKYEVIFSGQMASEVDILFPELPVDSQEAAAEYFINKVYDMLATSRKVSVAIKAAVEELAMDFIAVGDVLLVDKGGNGIQVWLFNPIKFVAEVVAFTMIEKVDAGGTHHFYPALVFKAS